MAENLTANISYLRYSIFLKIFASDMIKLWLTVTFHGKKYQLRIRLRDFYKYIGVACFNHATLHETKSKLTFLPCISRMKCYFCSKIMMNLCPQMADFSGNINLFTKDLICQTQQILEKSFIIPFILFHDMGYIFIWCVKVTRFLLIIDIGLFSILVWNDCL